MRPMILTLATALLVGGATPLPVEASGSYPGPGIRPAVRVNTPKYELGKAVFNGKATMAAGAGNAEVQGEKLKAWQQALPVAAAKTVNLPALAGKLTTEQIEALQYFLEIRYNLKKAAQ
jgi:hypothetical protein